MTASATHQLWPCWKKRDRARSAKNAAEREGTAAAQELLIVPTRGREAQSLSPPSPFPTPPGPHSSPQLAGLHCPRGCHLPPAQPEPSVLGTEPQPRTDQEEATGPPYLTHLSLHQRPSAVPPQMTPTNSKTRNKTMREGATRKQGSRCRNKHGHSSIQPLDPSAELLGQFPSEVAQTKLIPSGNRAKLRPARSGEARYHQGCI